MTRPDYRCAECAVGLPRKAMRHYCQICRVLLCGKHIYSWVDGNNRAITLAQPDLCATCYRALYPRRAS